MSSIRISSSTLCAIVILLFSAFSVNASDVREVVRSFTSEIPQLPQTLGQVLADNLVQRHDSSLSSARLSGNVYSLAVITANDDSEIGLHAQNIALMKARMHLAFLVGEGEVDRKLFRYDDALGSALLNYYQAEISARGIAGIQTASEIVDGYALGLAWLDDNSAENLASHVPERGTLDDEYCRFLYRQHASRLFRAGKFSDALPVFRNIHEFRWSDIDAYLDASECFLRTGQTQDCVKLLRELMTELNAKMTSHNLQRAGKLFREAGDKKAAVESLRAARKRLHEEQRKGN